MTTTRHGSEGGPPPGWPAAAVPSAVPAAVADPALAAMPGPVATEFAFPPVDPGFKRGAPTPIPHVAASLPATSGYGAATSPKPPEALASSPTLVMERTTPVMGAPAIAAPGVAGLPAHAQPMEAVPIAPLAVAPPVPLPAVSVAEPPAKLVRSGGSRLAVLAVIGVVLIGGTALGSFLYLRKSSASAAEDASASPAAKRPKKGAKKAPTAAPDSTEPVVEDTPPPAMQADSAAPEASGAPTASGASAKALPHLKPRITPLRRAPAPKP